jgi:hypothetical protein
VVTRRLAEALLRTAARQWPVELRDDLRREWTAELHVLATRRRRLQMLRFAASLATGRFDGPLVGHPPVRGRIGRTAAALLLAPLAGVGIILVSAIVMSLVVGQLLADVEWSARLQLPLLSTLTAGLALVLARHAASWARHNALTGPLRTALGIMLPVGVLTVAVEYADRTSFLRVPGLVSWLIFLTLVLWGAARLAGRGRVRAAWWFGVVGALVAADLAVILTVVNQIPGGPETVLDGMPPGDTVDRVSAPLWLVTSWTDWSFGLGRPTPWERFLITDLVEVQSILYLALSPYALAYAINGGISGCHLSAAAVDGCLATR